MLIKFSWHSAFTSYFLKRKEFLASKSLHIYSIKKKTQAEIAKQKRGLTSKESLFDISWLNNIVISFYASYSFAQNIWK